ncbi:serine hydrolase domain-containing protein [Stenotrophomonas sp. 24(2023)]|uniref:serine hydrolase domain-containing protein n=1 Tax=Stenotrophomonas sp. 24(2023) TaxID=3068324 RepID=UPI0027DF297E|nr:serine hydrolase domain-containing protein [Stenotrophomonas sp. 24(2023)]WMJ68472.1 serine hydrolase domain-containing protein [Stenotrophomonas sp. 24(2023)]
MKHRAGKAIRRAAAFAALLLPMAAVADEQPSALDREARIARVEQGLSPRIVVAGVPRQRMTLPERMAFHGVPAVGIALVDQGRVQWARTYGVRDAAGQPPATAATLFQAGSISKTVSALGALRLVEQGRLSLDAEANAQLQHWKIPDNAFTQGHPVTLRALLNHAAGTNVHGFEGYPRGAPVPNLLQVLDGVPPATSPAVRVEATPGTAWTYSGGGYSVVQQLMVEAGGQPFAALMQSLVLAPLQMRDSTFEVALPAAWQARAASGHHGDGQVVPGGWHVYPESAAAGLWSTPADLAQVVVDIARAGEGTSGTVLSAAMTQALLRRGLGQYGLGVYVEGIGAGRSFAHSGGTDGFRAQLYGYTHTGQGIVVMTNSDNGAALIDEILVSVAAEYGWPEFQIVEKRALASDAAANARFAGQYQLVGKPAHVIAEGEHLYLQSDVFGRQRMELHAESPTRFFATAQDMTVEFAPGTGGEVPGFVLIRGDSRYPAQRVQPGNR